GWISKASGPASSIVNEYQRPWFSPNRQPSLEEFRSFTPPVFCGFWFTCGTVLHRAVAPMQSDGGAGGGSQVTPSEKTIAPCVGGELPTYTALPYWVRV